MPRPFIYKNKIFRSLSFRQSLASLEGFRGKVQLGNAGLDGLLSPTAKKTAEGKDSARFSQAAASNCSVYSRENLRLPAIPRRLRKFTGTAGLLRYRRRTVHAPSLSNENNVTLLAIPRGASFFCSPCLAAPNQ